MTIYAYDSEGYIGDVATLRSWGTLAELLRQSSEPVLQGLAQEGYTTDPSAVADALDKMQGVPEAIDATRVHLAQLARLADDCLILSEGAQDEDVQDFEQAGHPFRGNQWKNNGVTFEEQKALEMWQKVGNDLNFKQAQTIQALILKQKPLAHDAIMYVAGSGTKRAGDEWFTGNGFTHASIKAAPGTAQVRVLAGNKLIALEGGQFILPMNQKMRAVNAMKWEAIPNRRGNYEEEVAAWIRTLPEPLRGQVYAVKVSQDRANYRKGVPGRNCGDCSMFRAPSECTKVQGTVEQSGVCDYYEHVEQHAQEDNVKALYVCRPVVNAKDLIEWAKANGFDSCLPPEDMHVTICYSRDAVDWKELTPQKDTLTYPKGGLQGNWQRRTVAELGDDGAVVMHFDAPDLHDRWQYFLDHGASWDHEQYVPHITLTYQKPSTLDLNKLQPYTGQIILGPEEFKELVPQWASDIKEHATDDDGSVWVTREGHAVCISGPSQGAQSDRTETGRLPLAKPLSKDLQEAARDVLAYSEKHDKEQMQKILTPVSVNVSDLQATQYVVHKAPAKGKKPLFGKYGLHDFPVVARTADGQMFLLDGHHRTDLAMKAGSKSVLAYVIDIGSSKVNAEYSDQTFDGKQWIVGLDYWGNKDGVWYLRTPDGSWKAMPKDMVPPQLSNESTYKLFGDTAGHAFRGNQWTEGEHELHDFLGRMSEMQQNLNGAQRKGWPYTSIEQFVLQNGEAFPHKLGLPDKYSNLNGKLGLCFMNAYHLAEAYPKELTYVEGFATSHGVPLAHAWVVDKKNNVIDPTWFGKGKETKLGKDFNPAYYGVKIPLHQVNTTIVARKKYGVLYNPEQSFPLLTGKQAIETQHSVREYFEGPGHPFRGNQWTTGEAGGAPNRAQIMARGVDAYPPAQAGQSLLENPHHEGGGHGGLDTLQKYTRADGTLTPERKQLHDAIVEDALQGHAVQDPPVAYLMGGGGASGKSVMQAQLTGLPEDRVHVDVDQIRTKLPEWKQELDRAAAAGEKPNPYLGTYTHEEASVISKRIIDEAAKRHYNIMIDGAGDSDMKKLEQNVQRYRAGGAKVIANYVTVDYDEAYRRMRARGDQIGRYIPAAHLRAVHSTVARLYPDAVSRGLFDEHTLWDTSSSHKLADGTFSPPLKVESGKGSSSTIHDQAAWERFTERGNGIAPRAGEI